MSRPLLPQDLWCIAAGVATFVLFVVAMRYPIPDAMEKEFTRHPLIVGGMWTFSNHLDLALAERVPSNRR
jgi:hypothetical protein